MATIASQVVLHPTVSQSLKYGSTTLGRDKAYRAIQYFARFYAWYLLSKGDKDAAARWNALKTHLGTARKLLRLGKPMEHLQAALRACLSTGPAVEQVTTIARQISYFGYLTFDAFVWANSIKFWTLNPETSTRVAKISNRFWFAGILFSIVNGVTKSVRLARETKKLQSTQKWGEKTLAAEAERETRLSVLLAAQENTRHQLIIDLLDAWIPATALGITNLNEGALGIFGLITSLIAAQKQWEAVNGKK
ncbi:peroxisomal biogenesis factor 11 [Dendrothele bispora CBS 962.96]|uniref:Peroxisomal biogenesis factor 11 n=1 Tax=Dendrothele bispora (strain CBS 962.96) TaxID=1314807 RepID=A0A4S8LRA7_DENBC|nr:peroxisomal biogenesis factor 11 [Dendrothele bispora CBS 962.96]THV04817.1 peroxisomal biogenesis factor 11 [Dendrothele bispora CBS 962.96]